MVIGEKCEAISGCVWDKNGIYKWILLGGGDDIRSSFTEEKRSNDKNAKNC